MTAFPYRVRSDAGAPTLGLVVLQVDETIERDMRLLFPPSVGLHVSRVPSGVELDPDTIAPMRAHLPAAAALLPPGAAFDAVAYACTSGTAQIGADSVRALIGGACQTRHVTDPLSAAIAACRALGAARIGIVSPYIPAVGEPVKAAFEADGVHVGAMLSFGEAVEARVARIDPASVREAAEALARSADVDAIFLSCTNLRTLEVIADLESTLDRPVFGSNLALAWHMARLAGAPFSPSVPGRLLACDPLPRGT